METLGKIILNVKVPIIITKSNLNWNCFNKSFASWCSEYKEEINKQNSTTNEIDFEYASRKHSGSPQWEKFRKKVSIDIEDFYKNSTNENNEFFKKNWAALSYKNIQEIPEKCRQGINFNIFGFADIEENDTTFWLSSSGANTPCHYDTYGCNVVVQVYGRKQWFLFPPTSKLTPIRVPYEESSVYCLENFYSPKDLRQFDDIKVECYKCVLEAGDILIVPRMWWHYVENLETSLSVNHWIPLKIDLEAQIDECIVKYLIEKFILNSSDDQLNIILNPNQISEISSEQELLSILNYLTKEATNTDAKKIKKLRYKKQYSYQYLEEEQVINLIETSKFEINFLKKISPEDFLKEMKLNSLRFEENISTNEEIIKLKIILINSICNPNIIKSIRNLYIQNTERQKSDDLLS